MTEHMTELGVGGIFCCAILKLVFDFLEKQKLKKDGGQTMYIRKPVALTDCEKHVAEIHDILLAPPPRESLVSAIREIKISNAQTAQHQKETVAVLEQIRDNFFKLGDQIAEAKCQARPFRED